jgi:hypothetical protein
MLLRSSGPEKSKPDSIITLCHQKWCILSKFTVLIAMDTAIQLKSVSTYTQNCVSVDAVKETAVDAIGQNWNSPRIHQTTSTESRYPHCNGNGLKCKSPQPKVVVACGVACGRLWLFFVVLRDLDVACGVADGF